jgi:hypothetical protein
MNKVLNNPKVTALKRGKYVWYEHYAGDHVEKFQILHLNERLGVHTHNVNCVAKVITASKGAEMLILCCGAKIYQPEGMEVFYKKDWIASTEKEFKSYQDKFALKNLSR